MSDHRRLPAEWTIYICPECNGQTDLHHTSTHTGDCPNRDRIFKAEPVTVIRSRDHRDTIWREMRGESSNETVVDGRPSAPRVDEARLAERYDAERARLSPSDPVEASRVLADGLLRAADDARTASRRAARERLGQSLSEEAVARRARIAAAEELPPWDHEEPS